MSLQELYHHGIKGQRWGVRRYQNEDGTLTSAGKVRYKTDEARSLYSDKQYKRDKKVYGRLAANRINRNMIDGSSISGERSREADRLNSFSRVAMISGKAGKAVGTALGVVGSIPITNLIMKKTPIGGMVNDTGKLAINVAIGTGMAEIGGQLGRIGTQSIAMLTGGYSPLKKR